MIVIPFYLFIIIYVISFFIKSTKIKNLFNANFLKSYFSNVEIILSNTNITLYKCDKSGENFLFAIKNNSILVTLNDLDILYETAEKYHIHNKIFITEQKINNSTILYKKIKEYQIEVWNNEIINKFISSNTSDNHKVLLNINSSNIYSGSTYSVLKTSDTSDDTCEIEECFDPIQEGSFKTHNIFSIFKDKPDHL